MPVLPQCLPRHLAALALMVSLAAPAVADEMKPDSSPLPAVDTTERDAVLAVVTQLFDGMRARNEALLRSAFAPGARLGKQDAEGFINAVVNGSRHLDEITFDETVLVDDDLAMAWTPYNIFVDREFHHCGVDLFVMRRGEGGWRITYLDDTRHTDGCDPDRRN